MKYWHGAAIGLLTLGVAACGGGEEAAEDTAMAEGEKAAMAEGEKPAMTEDEKPAMAEGEKPAMADGEKPAMTGGEESASTDMAMKEAIESRQQHMKDMGDAFRTISTQLRSGAPNVEEIKLAAATVERVVGNIDTLFPEGSGMSSGVETEALDAIWENPQGFAEAKQQLKSAAPGLIAAAQSGDIAALGEHLRPAGGACSNCHENFRLDDD